MLPDFVVFFIHISVYIVTSCSFLWKFLCTFPLTVELVAVRIGSKLVAVCQTPDIHKLLLLVLFEMIYNQAE